MQYEDIIPITYFQGTGGNMLSHLIISAKINDKNLISLSETGNAHTGFRDIDWCKSWDGHGREEFIVKDLPRLIKSEAIKPYYIPMHLYDIKLVRKSFKKSIRITFDLDDAEDIAMIYYKKFYNTGYARELITELEYSLDDLISDAKVFGCKKYKQRTDIPNILFISWKELFKGDIKNLIDKLSAFTNINYNNFSQDSLIYWRETTQKCLS